eukprot:TRINITY_DN25831_c0_g1_i1.p1 TRINITY_DN25831_c0_g1~~TRINITY_DN25831_c0_g1_i1.p1  ORF type:complete len:200 (-),score=3.19 TRINITY_DN25831_c0_g1_i1:423-1022(-)
MVLWEIAVGTAYFLGLKRTYKLALRIQRRLVSPKHPKIRDFIHRRTRTVFDTALSIHRHIQQRDIEVGRNFGNWILRWLDRMKPSAQIRGELPGSLPRGSNAITKNVTNSGQSIGTQRPNIKVTDRESNGRVLASPVNIRPISFPTLSMMMRPAKPFGMNNHYRHMQVYAPNEVPKLNFKRGGFEGVFRTDIAQWMLQN